MNPADQLSIIHRVKVVLLDTVATVNPCEMHKRQYSLVAESKILAAKCIGEKLYHLCCRTVAVLSPHQAVCWPAIGP